MKAEVTFLINSCDKAVVEYMKAHPGVCMVDTRPRWVDSIEEKAANRVKYADVEDSFLERNNNRFNIICSPGIWRTNALRTLLRPHEDVWNFDRYVGLRARKYGWKVV